VAIGFKASAVEETSDDRKVYEAITCLACKRVHLVNSTTGKVVGK
jgi:hypothetical protein